MAAGIPFVSNYTDYSLPKRIDCNYYPGVRWYREDAPLPDPDKIYADSLREAAKRAQCVPSIRPENARSKVRRVIYRRVFARCRCPPV